MNEEQQQELDRLNLESARACIPLLAMDLGRYEKEMDALCAHQHHLRAKILWATAKRAELQHLVDCKGMVVVV